MTASPRGTLPIEGVDLQPAALRAAYGCFPSGVIALCTLTATGPQGMTASSFTSVSLVPPLVSVCIGTTSETWPKLKAHPRLGISVAARHQSGLYRRLAAKGIDRFADVEWSSTELGAVFLAGAAACFECELSTEMPAGDHSVVLFRVRALHVADAVEPLVFHNSRFRQLTDTVG